MTEISGNEREAWCGVAAAGSLGNVTGRFLLRYGLVLVLAWIGAMKFTSYEAEGIQPLVASSPLLDWVYGIASVHGFSACLGLLELSMAVMIALRPVSAGMAALGSGLAALMFATTLTFLFSAPGWEPSAGGFPALSVVPGQFVLKDIVLLGAACWCFGEALSSHNICKAQNRPQPVLPT